MPQLEELATSLKQLEGEKDVILHFTSIHCEVPATKEGFTFLLPLQKWTAQELQRTFPGY